MRTSPTTSRLSKPTGRNRIAAGEITYIQTRTKLSLFDLVHAELRKSGISQAELAARLGKGTDRICKILGAPGNLTLDTVSELLFAISGGVLNPTVFYPLETARRNETVPHWVDFSSEDWKPGTSDKVTTSEPLHAVSP